jgi:hypothetical protein
MASDLPDAIRHRDLVFADDPPGQVERAYALLSGLDGLQVERGVDSSCLHVSYSLLDYSLETLELALIKQGFHLDNSTLTQIGRKLTYYREEVEYHNLNVPERHTKSRQSEIFVKAYEHHLHGDHDDTPPELREYK